MPKFSLKDSSLRVVRAQVTPIGYVPGGPPISIVSHTKLTANWGGKANYMKGSGLLPIDIVLATAEPSLKVTCSDGSELSDARSKVGGVGSPVIVYLDFAREGMIPTGFLFTGAVWVTGGGIELEEKGWGADELEIMFTDCLQDGESIHNRFA